MIPRLKFADHTLLPKHKGKLPCPTCPHQLAVSCGSVHNCEPDTQLAYSARHGSLTLAIR